MLGRRYQQSPGTCSIFCNLHGARGLTDIVSRTQRYENFPLPERVTEGCVRVKIVSTGLPSLLLDLHPRCFASALLTITVTQYCAESANLNSHLSCRDLWVRCALHEGMGLPRDRSSDIIDCLAELNAQTLQLNVPHAICYPSSHSKILLQKGRIADFVVNGAMVIGHESSGWVSPDLSPQSISKAFQSIPWPTQKK